MVWNTAELKERLTEIRSWTASF